MPLGNGPPLGLPSTPPAVFSDLRSYDTPHVAAGETGFNPLSRISPWPLSPYEKVIASTPGLAMWWPFSYAPGGYSYFTYGDAAGCSTLLSAGSGSGVLVPGLIPGSKSQALKLSGNHYLATQDYRVWPMGFESLMSVEFWINFQTIGTDSALVGEWDDSSNGWMLYSSSADLRIYCGGNNLTLSAPAFVTNKTYHVVGVWGGSQSPTADYNTRVYLNAVDVLHGNLVLAGGTSTITSNAHMQINAYGNTDGAPSLGKHAFTIQHLAFYNRMLQPREVAQHYQAGFVRG